MMIYEFFSIDEDDLVESGFCDFCDAIETEDDINAQTCPSYFCPNDVNCIRKNYYEEILEEVEEVNQKINQIIGSFRR